MVTHFPILHCILLLAVCPAVSSRLIGGPRY